MLPHVYIKGNPFPMYAIMATFGVAFVLVIGLLKRKAFDLQKRDIVLLVVFATVGALVGAIGQIVNHGGETAFGTPERWLRILSAGGVFCVGRCGHRPLRWQNVIG
jgi:uncharacterized membrane protein